jgi:hypothetical protein
MQNTKQQILELLRQAQELLEGGDYTVDGIPTSDDILADAMDEMLQAIENASEKIGYYLD